MIDLLQSQWISFVKFTLIQIKASRSLVSNLFSCCLYSICHNFDRMYRHSVAFQVKRTVVIKEHQLHFFLSVQSLLSHVYTESVLYEEILRITLDVFHKRVAFLHHSRSISLWILSLLKQWKMTFIVSELLNTASHMTCLLSQHLLTSAWDLWLHWTDSDLVQVQILVYLLLSLRQSV